MMTAVLIYSVFSITGEKYHYPIYLDMVLFDHIKIKLSKNVTYPPLLINYNNIMFYSL